MIDYNILDRYQSNALTLRAVFTAPAGGEVTPDIKAAYAQMAAWVSGGEEAGIPLEGEPGYDEAVKNYALKLRGARDDWEDKVKSRLDEGWLQCRRGYRFYLAADLAWDDKLVPRKIPLMLYAQGKIDLAGRDSLLAEIESRNTGSSDIMSTSTDPSGKQVVNINIPRLFEVSINWVRPYILRRHAAQVNRYVNLFPWLECKPRANTMVGKLKASALSQREDIFVEQWGIKTTFAQAQRDMLLYTHSVLFRNCSWEKIYSIRKVPDPATETGSKEETFIEKEGWGLVVPHPSRVFWDRSCPLSGINTDTGPEYIGYWDIARAGKVMDEVEFWNRGALQHSSSAASILEGMTDYRAYYYPTDLPAFPRPADDPDCGPFGGPRRYEGSVPATDAKSSIGFYSSEDRDSAIVLTHYYEKVIPRKEGLGYYPHPVWLHLIVANDRTVVYAEFEATAPACVVSYNENDSRLMSVSMAHEIMPYQDQIQQLLDQVVYLLKLQSMVIMVVNKDVLDDKIIKEIKTWISGGSYLAKPELLEASFSKIEQLAERDGRARSGAFVEAFQSFTVQLQLQINTLFSGIIQLQSMLEHNLMLSPQELGQLTTKETNATEIVEVSKTTNALYEFISTGADAARAALKRMIYESLVAHSTAKVALPIVEQYPDSVIEKAGFERAQDEGDSGETAPARNIMGDPQAMVYDYIFDNRDGSQRPSNSETAAILSQLTSMILGAPDIRAQLSSDTISAMLSEVFRMAGSNFTIKFENGSNISTVLTQLQSAVQQLAQVEQADRGAVQQLAAWVQQIASATGVQLSQAQQAGPPQGQPQQPQARPQMQQVPRGPMNEAEAISAINHG